MGDGPVICVFVVARAWAPVVRVCVFVMARRPDLLVVYVSSRGHRGHRVCASGMRRVRILHPHVGEPKHSIV